MNFMLHLISITHKDFYEHLTNDTMLLTNAKRESTGHIFYPVQSSLPCIYIISLLILFSLGIQNPVCNSCFPHVSNISSPL
jgi:hypothetical protein